MNDSVRLTQLTPVKQALLKIQSLRQELDELRAAASEPIAIIGMGCRLPGGCDSPELLWQLLEGATDAITKVPADRWTDDVYDPQPGKPGSTYCRDGGFIEGVDQFDPELFGISPREARLIDPQQRLLLEVVWQATEDARLTKERLSSSRTGVFVGLCSDDYARFSESTWSEKSTIAYTGLGTARSIAAGRVAYIFGLHGPVIQVDTSCSSSATAVHLACQSLRAGECDLAIAGGVNLILSPEMTIALSELQALSPDGRCKTFDAKADGYGRGEGCGVLVLARLSDAKAAGRPIRALVRGSAMNHDGKSNGLTAPNGRAQRDVIREALTRAGISPANVGYVEAHGTGTPLGDPVELRALHDVYCRDVAREHPLYIGTIKSNIGHLEAAASVASLMKVILTLQKGEIPPNLHFSQPTPHMDWQSSSMRVVDKRTRWPESSSSTRIASVSSFGMSGTNVHLVLESCGESRDEVHGKKAVPKTELVVSQPQIVAISAHSVRSLHRSLDDHTRLAEREQNLNIRDLAHALRFQRDAFNHRVGIVAASREELLRELTLKKESLDAANDRGTGLPGAGKLAWVFSGQGSQYGGMAQGLYRRFAPFRQVIDQCDARFRQLGDIPLIDVLWGSKQALIDDTRYTQPALFAVEYALARLWTAWGIQPSVLIGHSVGEYAAACVAGVFAMEDAFRLIAARGRLMQELTLPGSMCAVFAAANAVAPRLAAFGDEIVIATDNAPRSCVVAGRTSSVEALVRDLNKEGINTRPLNVSRAFHSPLMAPMLDQFREVAASVHYSEPAIRLISNVTGAYESAAFTRPDYWVEHVRKTVQFRSGITQSLRDGADAFLELGPGSSFAALARQCGEMESDGRSVKWLHSFDRRQDECAQMLRTLGELFEAGQSIDWQGYEQSEAAQDAFGRMTLPPYPLDRASYWIGERAPVSKPAWRRVRAVSQESEEQGLLGRALRLPAMQELRFEKQLHLSAVEYLRGHRVDEQIVFPAAAFIEMAVQAARHARGDGQSTEPAGDSAVELRGVTFRRPLLLDEQNGTVLGTVISDRQSSCKHFEIFARQSTPAGNQHDWERHCIGELTDASHWPSTDTLERFRALCTEVIPVEDLYDRFGAAGLQYSGLFRPVRTLMRSGSRALAYVELPGKQHPDESSVLHPALLDGCFHAIAGALWTENLKPLYLPMRLERLCLRTSADIRKLWCCVEVRSGAPLIVVDLSLFDAEGKPVGSVSDFRLAPVNRLKFSRKPSAAIQPLYQWDWKPLQTDGDARPADRERGYVVFSSGTPLASELIETFHRLDYPRVTVCTEDPAHSLERCVDQYKRVLQGELARSDAAPDQMLIYVLADEMGALPQLSGTAADAAVLLGTVEGADFYRVYERFAAFWRAVHDIDWAGKKVCVCVLTRGGQRVEGIDRLVQPGHAAAWGLGRSLIHESPDVKLLLIDVPYNAAHGGESVLTAIRHGWEGTESQLAIRGDSVYVPRLRGKAVAPRNTRRLSRGTYLVTGGRGAIGTRLVEWLIGMKAQKIVSLSRKLPETVEQNRLRALATERGVAVEFVEADISQYERVRRTIELIEQDTSAPLKGIFHAAGHLDDGLLISQEAQRAVQVLAPKVEGTLNLHRCTVHLSLDAFVCFSSIVSCIGSPGQSAYGAANAYMDAIASLRNGAGLCAHTMNWGPWAGSGMAARQDTQRRARIRATGISELDADEAMATLESLIDSHFGQSLIWRVDVDALLRYAAGSSMNAIFEDLRPARASAPSVVTTDSGGLAAYLRTLSTPELKKALQSLVLEQLAETLNTSPAKLDSRAPLIGMGMDSLMAAELRGLIRQKLQVDVPFGRLLEGATVLDLVQILSTELADSAIAETEAERTRPRADASRGLDAVSTEAVFEKELESGVL